MKEDEQSTPKVQPNVPPPRPPRPPKVPGSVDDSEGQKKPGGNPTLNFGNKATTKITVKSIHFPKRSN